MFRFVLFSLKISTYSLRVAMILWCLAPELSFIKRRHLILVNWFKFPLTTRSRLYLNVSFLSGVVRYSAKTVGPEIGTADQILNSPPPAQISSAKLVIAMSFFWLKRTSKGCFCKATARKFLSWTSMLKVETAHFGPTKSMFTHTTSVPTIELLQLPPSKHSISVSKKFKYQVV